MRRILRLTQLKVLCGQPLAPDDLVILDPELHARLCKLSAIASAYAHAIDTCATIDSASLLFDGCPISELGLTFIAPGCEGVEIIPGGSSIEVALHNLAEYVSAARRWTLHTGVQSQLESL
jgi:hypothetical protein